MTDINRLKNQARRYEQQEQWPRAIELYVKAIDAIEAQGFGTDLSLYNRVGDLYLRQGDTARAVSFYERAVDRYAEQGLQTSAVALCNKILRIAPGRSEIYRTLGRLHAETGLQSQARRSFMEYASRMEDAGELAAAVEALDEFVKLSADEEARTALGRYLITQQRVEEGVSHLRQVLAAQATRGETSDEIVALIEEVAPGQSDVADMLADDEPFSTDDVPLTEDALADTDDALPEAEDALPEAEDALSDTEEEPSQADDVAEDTPAPLLTDDPAPLLTEDEAAELDQIIADLGGLDLDGGSGEPSDTPSAPFVVESTPLETLGASISVSDSTLHDLLSEFQAEIVARGEDTDSAIHYDLGVAYKEMGMLDDAIREFTIAIQNDHGLLGAHQLLTESLIQKGQYDAGVGAMAEYVKAVEPENDVSGQMERVSELLRASPSEETLTELKQLLRSIGDPASEGAQNGSQVLDGISVDELFPDLEEAWESTSGEDVAGIEEPAMDEVGLSEGSLNDNAEAGDSQDTLVEEAEIPELEETEESELEAALAPLEVEEPASSEPADSWEPSAEAVEEGAEPEGLLEPVDEPAADKVETEDLAVPDGDENALQALSEALGEPLDDWAESGEQPTWDPESMLEEEAEAPSWEAESGWQPEAELEAEISDEEEPEAELEAEISDEEEPEAELEAEVSDEAEPEAELEAEISDEEEPAAEPAADHESEDLGGLLFGARLAKFRARMARSASETDFQAHYDLGLAYKEVALFDEAIAELLVAITGPANIARKSLRLMSDVADLSNDDSLRFTTAEHLNEHGMTAEALEQLTKVFDARLASGGDTAEVGRRMSAIDPNYLPPSVEEARDSAPEELEQASDSAATREPDSEDLAVVSSGFDSILDELRIAGAEADIQPLEADEPVISDEGPEADEPLIDDESEAADSVPDEADTDEADDLKAWEIRTAELLEEGQRDDAIRELYRLQAAYEAQEDFTGAMRAVSNLLLLDPEDVILHHQQVEYSMLLEDNAALASANLDLGRCLERQGATSNARAAFEQVLAIDPENETAVAAIEALDASDEDDDSADGEESEDSLEVFAIDDPVHYETHFELGVAFKQDGLHDEAVYELEIAARGLEDPTPAYELLGELFNDAGQHETTTKVLGRALEANGRDDSELVGVLYQLGVGHQEMGDTDQAAECFRRVLEVTADYRDAEDRLNACSL